MRASSNEYGYLAILLGDFKSEHMQHYGWYKNKVFHVCLPIFVTFLVYLGLLIAEYIVKKPWLLKDPKIAGESSSEKYQEKKQELPLSEPPKTPENKPIDPTAPPEKKALAEKDIEKKNEVKKDEEKKQTKPEPLAEQAVITIRSSSSEMDEFYLWEDLLIYMLLHVMSCVFSIHQTKKASNQGSLTIILAWVHFVLISVYAFISVELG